jgi:HK97 family phage portal protein
MSIFSRALSWLGMEQKANPSFGHYMEYGQLPQPVQMQANPKAFMKEGYRRSDTVHKCVSYAARNAAGIRLALYTDRTRKREIKSHPLLDLLTAPNKDMSGNDYIESVNAYTLLIGNSYEYALRLAPQGPPDELWVLTPAIIDIVPGRKGIVRYDYRIQEPPVAFAPELIGHTKFWNPSTGVPGDDLYGLSPIEVAGIFVDMNLAYRKWNLALTQNMAQPPGAWTTPALMGEKEREKLEAKVNQKYSGYKNAGKAPVLDGGLEFKSYAVPPAQMNFLEGQGYNSNQIANIYNLAPQVIGDSSASTYDNFEQAVYGSYTECIFPLMDKRCGTWNRWLVPMYPDLKASGAVLGYDKQSVETIQKMMQAQESAKSERWTKVWLAGGCTLNEYRDKITLPAAKQGGDSYRIKDILIAEADLEKYAEQCLTAPAAQTLPVPEGTPPSGTTVEGSLAKPPALPAPKPKPGTQPKKSLDSHDIYQPDDLAKQLSLLKGQGVTQVEWKSPEKYGPCDICAPNVGQIRTLGDAFPSGHILPVAHPNCECFVEPVAQKSMEPISIETKRTLRDEYKEFQRRHA